MGSESTQNMRVSGDSSGGVATVSGLAPATMYTVVVAAENRAGTGDYSDRLTIDTPSSEYIACIQDNNTILYFRCVYISVLMMTSFLTMAM